MAPRLSIITECRVRRKRAFGRSALSSCSSRVYACYSSDSVANQNSSGSSSPFAALERLRLGRSRRKIPYIQQLTAVECGAASLAMVLGYHGKSVGLDEVRRVIGVSRDGTSLLAILTAARWFGLRGRGVKVDIEELEYL